jgi:dynein heavy chain, axonemal
VVAAVRLHLKDVKKGWFNLEETSNEVYRFSKLRAFLQYLNFLMQDTLQFMVADSLRDYARFLKRACLHQVCNGTV